MNAVDFIGVLLSDDSAVVATWIGAMGAVAAWLTIVIEVRRRQTERKMALKDAYDGLFGSRQTFWTEIRKAYAAYIVRKQAVPSDMEALIRAAGSPPGLGKTDLFAWPATHGSRLGPDQRVIWDFAQCVYPARDNLAGRVTEHSLVARVSEGRADDFHKARAEHAKLWNKWAQLLSIRYLSDSYESAHDQWVLLSWLELALGQWTRDPGLGKVWLFRLAAEASRSRSAG